MLTIPDFLRHIESGTATGLGRRLNELLQRTPGPTSAKPEVVGQIMTTGVYAATIDTPIAELVHHLAEKGLHHIPVLDGSRRVVGIVAQSDAIAALYKRIALSAA
jgi:CBS domain-containing membrane protein